MNLNVIEKRRARRGGIMAEKRRRMWKEERKRSERREGREKGEERGKGG